jgi:hypothetical protein
VWEYLPAFVGIALISASVVVVACWVERQDRAYRAWLKRILQEDRKRGRR